MKPAFLALDELYCTKLTDFSVTYDSRQLGGDQKKLVLHFL